MLSTDFQFFAPTALDEALALLHEHQDGGKVLSGGMSMMPAINLGVLRPTAIVSLNHVPGLDGLEDAGDHLRIGGLVRHHVVQSDPLVRAHAPLLAQAASVIADVQVRHRGTIGGSVAHADPSADYLPVLVALDATVELASASGTRDVRAREFFVDVMMTALALDEIVVGLRVPKVPAEGGSAYVRLARVEGSFAIACAAAVAVGDRVSLGVGGAVPTPVHLDVTCDGSEASLDAAAEAAFQACEDAYGDLNGSAEYRRAMARVYARRAIQQALAARG
ncbi:MAG: FAD binding domain-containing protein [Thermoleophilia bacterium]